MRLHLNLSVLALAGSLVACASTGQGLPDDRWLPTGDTSFETTYVQKGSFQETRVNGEEGASVVGMSVANFGGGKTLEKILVTRRSCDAGVGQLFVTTLGGDPKQTFEFAFGIKTLASNRAEVLCAGYLTAPKVKEH